MYKVALFTAEDTCKCIHGKERTAFPEGRVMTKYDYF